MHTLEASKLSSQEIAKVRETLSHLEENRTATALLEMLNALERGGMVTVTEDGDAEISPQEASKLLGISRPYLYRLLDTGVIPEQPRVGTHRKIKMRDIRAFRTNRELASRQFAVDLAHTQQANDQLVREAAKVSDETAAKFGF
ncbi:helix-turn-helix domain-containing protein [Arthrobacter sedimenti]|uniref:helix-turn-helix domain-containing protein n=1 Tax=Arthrobacter sedimenti TaxID=2694931 RepID=UPI000B34CDE4|nr:helix-turn-helix domain-containing protein [Arthrobacter sedimenti]OUM44664.1 hypothetical protein B8W73_02630 [Arthrobacter agilis]